MSHHGALLDSLVAALLPEQPVLAPEAVERVQADVVDFVAAEIAALPTHLRVPYRTALRAFDWSAVALHGRPFHALGLPERRRFVGAWADGRVELARDFVKLVRSCTLLEFYDHPLVMAAGPGAGGHGD